MKDSKVRVSSRYRVEAILFRLAREHSQKAQEMAMRYEKSSDILDLEKEIEHSIQAILLAHAFLEAYINLIGKDRLEGSSNISNQILWEVIQGRKPGFKLKWSWVVRAVTGKSLEDDRDLWNRLDKLNNLRNAMAHYKFKLSNGVESWEEKYFRAGNTIMAVSIAEQLVRKFHELDGSRPPDFLETMKAGKDYVVSIDEKIKLHDDSERQVKRS